MYSAGSRHGLAHASAIWLLVFTAGWFVMLTELVGARVLSPYFGNSIYVWGSVIAIFLLALAIGYAMGGKVTQKLHSPLMPSLFAAIAGLYVAATPLYQDALSAWLYNTGIHVKWGALIAACSLYGLPMALLGGISPFVIQIVTKTQLEVGRRAGLLYAMSTIGSFMGCLVTAFYLIPILPLSQVLMWGGLGMVAVAAISALTLADRIMPAAVMAVGLVAAMIVTGVHHPTESWREGMKAYEYPPNGYMCSKINSDQLPAVLKNTQAQAIVEAAKYASGKTNTLLETDTPYHHMEVVQEGPVRELIFGKADYRGAQSVVDLRNLAWHIAEYTQLSFAGVLYRPAPKRVCVIGVGGAVIPRSLELCFPGIQVDAIDIDPSVIKVARDYFFWQPSSNVRAYAQDGRSFLNWGIMNRQPLYDWIILDAYEDDYVPFHLTTQEFIHTAKRMLAPDGILVANMLISNDLYGCEARTFKLVFGNVSAFAGHRTGNIILVSQNGRDKCLTRAEAGSAAMKARLPREAQIDPRFIVGCLLDSQNWSDDGPVLSDMWAPTENLLKQR